MSVISPPAILCGGTSAEQSWHEIFFSRHEFSHEKCSEIFLKFLSLYLVGPKKSRKIPTKFPPYFPLPPKKIDRRASAGAPGEQFWSQKWLCQFSKNQKRGPANRGAAIVPLLTKGTRYGNSASIAWMPPKPTTKHAVFGACFKSVSLYFSIFNKFIRAKLGGGGLIDFGGPFFPFSWKVQIL